MNEEKKLKRMHRKNLKRSYLKEHCKNTYIITDNDPFYKALAIEHKEYRYSELPEQKRDEFYWNMFNMIALFNPYISYDKQIRITHYLLNKYAVFFYAYHTTNDSMYWTFTTPSSCEIIRNLVWKL